MSGMERPEESVDWSEVAVGVLIRERDFLELRLNLALNVLRSDAQAHEELQRERDDARSWAVRLEQELAEVTEWRDAWRTAALERAVTTGESL